MRPAAAPERAGVYPHRAHRRAAGAAALGVAGRCERDGLQDSRQRQQERKKQRGEQYSGEAHPYRPSKNYHIAGKRAIGTVGSGPVLPGSDGVNFWITLFVTNRLVRF
jgi:hypothetical protein